MDDRALMLSIIAVYMLICLGIGVWAAKQTKSSSDFFVAGKSAGIIVMGFASFSTVLSGFGFIGGPGLVYKYGTTSFWLCLPAALGLSLASLLLAKRFKQRPTIE